VKFLPVVPSRSRLDDPASTLEIKYQDITELKPYAKNARTHSKRQIRQIAESIKAFGFANPVLIKAGNTIIAGHGRVKAARLLNLTQVPTIQLAHLSEDQVRAYILADNKLAENAGWDESILRIELQHLVSLDSFDVTLTGFEVPEIDLLLKDESPETESLSRSMRVRQSPSPETSGSWVLTESFAARHSIKDPSSS
jgi:ParB-like chromosome segregation protein Spo0J